MPLPPVPIPPRLLRAGLEFRHRLLDLADRIVPSEAALWDVAAGVQRTKVAGALVTSGLADALGDGPRHPAELARELGLDPDVTQRVLRAARFAIDQRDDPDRPIPITSLTDLHMLVQCEGGRERTLHEVHAPMRDVGLEAGKIRHAGLHMLVEGIAR